MFLSHGGGLCSTKAAVNDVMSERVRSLLEYSLAATRRAQGKVEDVNRALGLAEFDAVVMF